MPFLSIELTPLLVDIEVVIMKTCLYTYHRYKIAKIRYMIYNLVGDNVWTTMYTTMGR